VQVPVPPRATGATPEGFSWSSLVEGMLDPHPQAPDDFSWLNHAAAANMNGGPTGTTPSTALALQMGGVPGSGGSAPPAPASNPTPPGNGMQRNGSIAVTSPNSGRDYRPESSRSPGGRQTPGGSIEVQQPL
jgi:hypothetical protein